MYSTSSTFNDAVRNSHVVVSKVYAVDIGTTSSVISGLPTSTETALPAVSGSVTLDNTREYRGTIDLTLVGDQDYFSPTTKELVPFRGIQFPDGTTEYVPLGVYRVTNYTRTRSKGQFVVRVTGVDRSKAVADAKLLDNFPIGTGSNVSSVIKTLVATAYSWTEFGDWYASTQTFPELTVEAGEASNPWMTASDMARSVGARIYFDRLGRCALEQVVEDLYNPVQSYIEDGKNIILELNAEQDLSVMYNGVIVTAESTGSGLPAQATVWDTEPTSPTYYLGKYGRKPYWYQSPLVTDETQAGQAAAALLVKMLGVGESLSWSQVVNPAHDPGDVVRVTNTETGINATVVVDAITIPLSPSDSMRAMARDRTVYL